MRELAPETKKQLCRSLSKRVSPEHYPAENCLPHPKCSDGLLTPPIWFYRGGRQHCPERALTCPRSHSRYTQSRHSSNPGLSHSSLPALVPEQPRGWGWAAWLQLSVYSSHSIRPDQTTWGGGSYGHCVSNKAQAVCQVLTCIAISALITHHQSHTAVTGHVVCSRHLYILSPAHQGSFQFILQGKQKRRAGRGFGASQETKLPQEKALVQA